MAHLIAYAEAVLVVLSKFYRRDEELVVGARQSEERLHVLALLQRHVHPVLLEELFHLQVQVIQKLDRLVVVVRLQVDVGDELLASRLFRVLLQVQRLANRFEILIQLIHVM